MMNIKQNLLKQDKYKLKCPYEMKPIGIVIHNTYNDASAKNEISYMINNDKSTSFHIAVDDIEAIQGLPLYRNSWANGDGANGSGNRKYISIEICYSKSGGEKFIKAEKNAAKVVAQLLKKYKLNIENVKSHRDFSGKNCPHRTNINEFKEMVKKELSTTSNTSNIGITNNTPVKDNQIDTGIWKNGDYSGKKAIVTSESGINIRYDRGLDAKIIAKAQKGTVLVCEYSLNGWVSVRGYNGNKGFGYVYTKNIKLI